MAGGTLLVGFPVKASPPSVTGNGEEAWFVRAAPGEELCAISTSTPLITDPNLACAVGGAAVRSVAVARDRSAVAVVFKDAPTNNLTVFDLIDPNNDREFTLNAPTIDGEPVANLLYADVMNFTADGQFLIFDALNELPVSGGTVSLWSIYALHIPTGIVQTLLPPTNGFRFDYPTLSQSSDNFLLFDAFELASSQSALLVGNLTTGALTVIDVVAGFEGAASYTGDDASVTYTAPDASAPSGTSLVRMALAGDRMTPAPPSVAHLTDADFGEIYRRGTYVGPPADADLDGEPDSSDNCVNEPNPGQGDGGGVGPASPADGIGDACQCGDNDLSSRVDQSDVDDLRQLLVGNTPAGYALQLCSVIGSVECNVADRAVLSRVLQGKLPAIAPVCSASLP